MLISKRMNDALNKQIGHEFYASLQYVAIASYFSGESLKALAAKFYQQAEEERDHAMRFVTYILEAGGTVVVPQVAAPRSSFKDAEDAIELSLNQEKTVTKQISALMDSAVKEGDHITQNFLQWFFKEQLEEVASMEELLRIVRRAGDSNLLYVEDYLSRHGMKLTVPSPKSDS